MLSENLKQGESQRNMQNEKETESNILNRLSFFRRNNHVLTYYSLKYSMTSIRQSILPYKNAIAFVFEKRSLKKQKVKNIIVELVYFGLFDRTLFDEYGILTSEELQKAIPCEIDERYRLIDKPRVRKDKKKAQKQPQQNEPLLSVEALKDELNDASVERIAKSVGTTDQSFIRATLDEFIAYQREIGNADNRTMTDMKKHFINFCKKKLKHNGSSTQNTRHSGNGSTVQSGDNSEREFWKNVSKNATKIEVTPPYDDVPF